MPIYMVERAMPGATIACMERLRAAAEQICRDGQMRGCPISYLGSTYTPGESRCRCLFEAASADTVRAINDLGGLPYSRIVIAVDLPGSGRRAVIPPTAPSATPPALEGESR